MRLPRKRLELELAATKDAREKANLQAVRDISLFKK